MEKKSNERTKKIKKKYFSIYIFENTIHYWKNVGYYVHVIVYCNSGLQINFWLSTNVVASQPNNLVRASLLFGSDNYYLLITL